MAAPKRGKRWGSDSANCSPQRSSPDGSPTHKAAWSVHAKATATSACKWGAPQVPWAPSAVLAPPTRDPRPMKPRAGPWKLVVVSLALLAALLVPHAVREGRLSSGWRRCLEVIEGQRSWLPGRISGATPLRAAAAPAPRPAPPPQQCDLAKQIKQTPLAKSCGLLRDVCVDQVGAKGGAGGLPAGGSPRKGFPPCAHFSGTRPALAHPCAPLARSRRPRPSPALPTLARIHPAACRGPPLALGLPAGLPAHLALPACLTLCVAGPCHSVLTQARA